MDKVCVFPKPKGPLPSLPKPSLPPHFSYDFFLRPFFSDERFSVARPRFQCPIILPLHKTLSTGATMIGVFFKGPVRPLIDSSTFSQVVMSNNDSFSFFFGGAPPFS